MYDVFKHISDRHLLNGVIALNRVPGGRELPSPCTVRGCVAKLPPSRRRPAHDDRAAKQPRHGQPESSEASQRCKAVATTSTATKAASSTQTALAVRCTLAAAVAGTMSVVQNAWCVSSPNSSGIWRRSAWTTRCVGPCKSPRPQSPGNWRRRPILRGRVWAGWWSEENVRCGAGSTPHAGVHGSLPAKKSPASSKQVDGIMSTRTTFAIPAAFWPHVSAG